MADTKRIIKKYPNRRLYDTETSAYITLGAVKKMVLDQIDIQVVDAKTQEDLTRSVLLQIILEEEHANGVPLFTNEVLIQLIRSYGNAMQSFMAPFLEKNMAFFHSFQEEMQKQAQVLYGETPLSSTMWNELMGWQAPVTQKIMNGYMEQSKNLFLDVQQQFQSQAEQMLKHFTVNPFAPSSDQSKKEAD